MSTTSISVSRFSQLALATRPSRQSISDHDSDTLGSFLISHPTYPYICIQSFLTYIWWPICPFCLSSSYLPLPHAVPPIYRSTPPVQQQYVVNVGTVSFPVPTVNFLVTNQDHSLNSGWRLCWSCVLVLQIVKTGQPSQSRIVGGPELSSWIMASKITTD